MRLIHTLLGSLCLVACGVQGFYLPGVAPTEYADGDVVEIKVCYCIRILYMLQLFNPKSWHSWIHCPIALPFYFTAVCMLASLV